MTAHSPEHSRDHEIGAAEDRASRADRTGSAPTALVVEPDHAAAEIEADRIARRVSESLADADRSGSSAAPIAVRAASRIRRRVDPTVTGTDPSGPEGGELDPATTTRIRRATGHGRPLDAPVRRSMERAFGTDLGHVRLHTGSASDRFNDRLGAAAFTLGDEIFVRGGTPDLTHDGGRELLAHEIAHTLQPRDETSVGRIRRRGKGKGKGGGTRGPKGRGPKSGKGPTRATSANGGRTAAGGATQRATTSTKSGGTNSGGTNSGGTTPTVAAPDADSAFTKLAPIIDAAVPSPGDSAGFEASLQIALDPGSFLQFDLAGEAERDERVTLGVEVSVGYGGQLPWGLSPSVLAKIGMSLEATAGTTAQALTLLSYTYYRMFRESTLVPSELADHLWGRGGTTGTTGYEEAEQWAAGVETSIFGADDDAEVSRGVLGAIEGELEFGEESSLSGGASYAWTTTYSKQTLEASGSSGQGQLGKVGKERAADGWLPWLTMGWFGRSPQLPVGETEHALSFESELSHAGFTGEVGLEVGLASPVDVELELSATGEFAPARRRPARMAVAIVGCIAQLRRIVATVRSARATLPQHAALLAEAADTLQGAIDTFSDRQDELAEMMSSKMGGAGTRELKLSVSIEREGGATTCTVALAEVSETEQELDWGAVSGEISVAKERRLFSMSWGS